MRIKDASYYSRLQEISNLLDKGNATPFAKTKALVLSNALASDYGLGFEEVHADALNRSTQDNTNTVRSVAELQPRPRLS